MSAPVDDRPGVAANYAAQMRDGRRRLRAQSGRTPEQRRALRLATRRAVIGVVTYSAVREDLDDAVEMLEWLEVERHTLRLRADAEELRANGATISERMISQTASSLGQRSATRELAGLDDRRREAGLEGL
jgi:hypothetical protein